MLLMNFKISMYFMCNVYIYIYVCVCIQYTFWMILIYLKSVISILLGNSIGSSNRLPAFWLGIWIPIAPFTAPSVHQIGSPPHIFDTYNLKQCLGVQFNPITIQSNLRTIYKAIYSNKKNEPLFSY